MNAMMRICAGAATAALSASVCAEPSVMQCFYECKRDVTGARFAEVTTLMIANENQPPAPGDHSNTHAATLVFVDGNERVIAQSRTLLSARDLDEVNVCATLREVGAPSAGLIQIAISDLRDPTGPIDGHGVSAWMKNVVGLFSASNPDPFRQRVFDVGKTHCRYLEQQVVAAGRLISDPEVEDAPRLDPVLIEGTADDTTN